MVAPGTIGNFQFTERLSITSYVSLLAGLNFSGFTINNSILSLDALFSVQWKWVPPNVISAFSSLINTSAFLVSAFVPGAAAVTLPAQMALNSIMSLYGIKQQIKKAIKEAKNPSINSTLQQVTAVTQAIISAVSFVVGGYLRLHRNTPQSSFHQPDFVSLIPQLIPNLLSGFSGNVNNSLINISAGSFFGTKLDNHLASFNLGMMAGPSFVNNSLFCVNQGWNAAFTGSTTAIDYANLGGNTWTVLPLFSQLCGYMAMVPLFNSCQLSYIRIVIGICKRITSMLFQVLLLLNFKDVLLIRII